MIEHWAILTTNDSDKRSWVKRLLSGQSLEGLDHFKGLKGALFSNEALNHFIEEEIRHDDYSIKSHHNKGVRFLSNGEQKQALLEYLIAQQLDFLLIDNTFDYLDAAKQTTLVSMLEKLSQSTPILQIVYRQQDLLPFIKQGFRVEKNTAVFQNDLQAHFEALHNHYSIANQPLPAALENTDRYSGKTLIELKNVFVSYEEHPILKNICWKIKRNEFWQLIGPNGSGKTTLLSMITGDNPKGYGQDITLFGRKKGSGENVWDIKKNIGYFTPSMLNRFTRRDNVQNMIVSGLYDSVGLYKRPPESYHALAHQWLQLLKLEQYKGCAFQQLSDGQQRLVMIARAMIKHPPLLILDEPTSGLDDCNIEIFKQLTHKIAQESNTSIIYVSHREEPGLDPKFRFELNMTESGSTGTIQAK